MWNPRRCLVSLSTSNFNFIKNDTDYNSWHLPSVKLSEFSLLKFAESSTPEVLHPSPQVLPSLSNSQLLYLTCTSFQVQCCPIRMYRLHSPLFACVFRVETQFDSDADSFRISQVVDGQLTEHGGLNHLQSVRESNWGWAPRVHDVESLMAFLHIHHLWHFDIFM